MAVLLGNYQKLTAHTVLDSVLYFQHHRRSFARTGLAYYDLKHFLTAFMRILSNYSYKGKGKNS